MKYIKKNPGHLPTHHLARASRRTELKDAIRTIGRIKRKLKPNQENEHEQHHQ